MTSNHSRSVVKRLKQIFVRRENGQRADASVAEGANLDGLFDLDASPGPELLPVDNQHTRAPPPGEPSPQLPTPINNDTPIRELWDIAYEKLREDDEELIRNYEEKLRRELGAGLVSPFGSKVSTRDRMHAVLQRKMEQVKQDIWKLKFGSSDVQVRDLVQPVLNVARWANHYISAAASANPQASMAWAGVSLLLSLLLNPSEQDAALNEGLEYISSLIDQSLMWEDLYIRRYEPGHNASESSIPTHFAYKSALEKLYRQILKFQATSYCYCAKNAALRLAVDVTKWNEWNGLLDDIRAKEREFRSVSDSWRDAKYDEECLATEIRHKEALRHWQAIGSGVSGLQKAVCDAQEEKKRDGFLNWLCEVDPSEIYNSARDCCEDGTGHWLLQDSKEFQTWENAPQSVLWLHGKPGCGKSVLSSSVIKHLHEKYASDPESAFAYFFFSFSDHERQKVPVMLASLVKQLYASRPDTPQPIEYLRVYKQEGTRPDTKTLEKALIATAAGFSSVSIVIDALDECPIANKERKTLLDSLRRIIDRMPDTVHIFLTSRKEPDIEPEMNMILQRRPGAVIDLTTNKHGVNHDIGLYIDKTFASAQYSSWPADVKAKAKRLLVRRADGMFQYLVCQFETFRTLSSAADIDEALERLPLGLHATYDRLIQNIDSSLQPRAISLLKWLVASERPLQLEELADTWMLRPECIPVVVDRRHKLFTPRDCLRCISSMTIQFREHETGGPIYVRLAHFSVKEYLTSDGIDGLFTEPEAHYHIAHSCLAYHLYLTTAGKNDVVQLSLGDYAARNWGFHLEKAPRGMWSDHVVRLAAQALVAYSRSLHEMISMRERELCSGKYTTHDYMLSRPLCYTAKLGFLKLTEILLRGDGYFTQRGLEAALIETMDRSGIAIVQPLLDQGVGAGGKGSKTPRNINASMVNLLLSKGADINAHNDERGSALEVAIRANDPHLVEYVIGLGADVNLPSINNWGYLLILAAYYSSTVVFKLLLDSGADVNAQGGEFGNALQTACVRHTEQDRRYSSSSSSSSSSSKGKNDHLGIVELLLSRGADINTRGGTWGTALQAACCSNGQSGLVKILLEKGADINIKGGKHGSALHAACARRNQEIIELLLCWGADVNLEGEEFGGVLHNALMHRLPARNKGCCNLAKLLRNYGDYGAKANSQGGEYGSALQAICSDYIVDAYDNSEDIVRMLLDHGAGVNAQGGAYGSALQAACCYSNKEIIRMLLDHGADINAQGGAYGSALQAACYYGYEGIIRMLLDFGADINAQGGDYGSVLQAACYYGNKDIVRMLLDHGADIHAQGGEYGNALQAACYHGNKDIVCMLLDSGANINAQGGKYGNILQAFCYRSNKDIVRTLLDHGADINAQGGRYGNALQAACYHGDKDIIRMLLDSGADIDAQGGRYGNILQAFCYCGNKDIVRMLLDYGADINAQSGKYGTALQAACSSGNKDVVHMLLDHGADVNAQSGEYGSALQATCDHSHASMRLPIYRQSGKFDEIASRHLSIARLLVEHGGDIHSQGGRFGTVWHAVASSMDDSIEPMLQFPLDHGTDVNDERGLPHGTALQTLLERCRLVSGKKRTNRRIRFLLERGADVNVRAGRYGFALQSACANKYGAEPVQFLLQNCPTLDVNAVGGIFGTALQAAAYSHQTESVTSLLDKGANPNIRGGKYRSALNIAIFRGFWDIVAILLDRGAKSDRQLLPEPDEKWLATVEEEGIEDWDPENDFYGREPENEDGKEAVERYRVFWRKQPRSQDEN